MRLLLIYFVSLIWSALLLDEIYEVEEFYWKNPNTPEGEIDIRRYPDDTANSNALHRALEQLASMVERDVMKKYNITFNYDNTLGNRTPDFDAIFRAGSNEETTKTENVTEKPQWYRDLESIVPRLIEDRGSDNIDADLLPIIKIIRKRFDVEILMILVRRRQDPKSDVRNRLDVLIDYFDPNTMIPDDETESQEKERIEKQEERERVRREERERLEKERKEREERKKINVAKKKVEKKRKKAEQKAREKLEKIEERKRERRERKKKQIELQYLEEQKAAAEKKAEEEKKAAAKKKKQADDEEYNRIYGKKELRGYRVVYRNNKHGRRMSVFSRRG